MDHKQLSKTLSYALRHSPGEFGLTLDKDGWVGVADVITALRKTKVEFAELSVNDIELAITSSSKKRHEIAGDRIRAVYGHSTPVEMEYAPGIPPEFLYHGTDESAAAIILTDGLKSMQRQYVHLSSDTKTAIEVGKRKSSNPVILKVDTSLALSKGIEFYLADNKIWLAKFVPFDCISKHHSFG